MDDPPREHDRVSWQRSCDDQRMYGTIVHAGGGFYVAKADSTGLRCALRGRDIVKERK